ncbi:TonB-dependent siderophore receptor [Sphingobium chlorophenolicum L-1]|uniref:TonB-dependent siderophore receptor n=1 Tax=Sphingobium chlorophenolicum L-1 TaxID=690566 RepID=F6ET44_SPHCR|nr:TonB-dependent siderophore receptor [Sphingobium chlorophenolicum]AEG50418.1 TonB-dependent siderophore receptor [Sphingobium chlorophenolicum L-1]
MRAIAENSPAVRAGNIVSILALLTALGGGVLFSPAFGAVAENADSEATASGSGRDDIVVTGQNPEYHTPDTTALKIDAPLRDIPQTIDVIPDQVIRDQRALSMQDAVRNVAGIGMATGDGQRDQFVIRGNIAYGDLFIDGVRDDALYFRDLSNIERIEILKGPASVLYGRGSSGGLINRVSKKPGTEGGEIVVSYGSWEDKRGEIDLGHVFTGNDVAVRLTGAIERSDSYRDQGFLRREAIAPSVLFAPSDRTRILLQADYLRDRRVTDNGIPAFQGRPVDVRASTYYGAANARAVDFSQSEVWSTTATLDHEFSDTLKLHNALRYYDYTLDRQNTIPNVVNEAARTVTLNRQSTDRAEHGWFNQLELSGRFSTGPLEHKLLLGFETGRQSKYELRIDRANIATVDLFDPVLPVLPLEVAGTPGTHRTGVYKTLGFYAQDMISLGEYWKALAGLRYDRFRQEVHQRIAGQPDLARTDTFWSPRIGLVWQPTPAQSYYISWNKSYQPSGETFALSTSSADIAPEKTINREIGAKFDLFDGKLSTTISAFDLKRSDIKATDPVLLRVVPVGVQRTRGIEISAQLELSQGWQAIASYAYLDARIIRSPALDSGVPIQGNRPTLTPVNSASLWLMRSFGDRFGLGGGVNYVGDRQANLANSVVLPEYITADAMAWARLGKLKAQLNIRNIFDRDYFVSGHGTVGNLNMPGAPRSAMLTLRYAID